MGNDGRKLMGSALEICKDLEEVLLLIAEEKGFSEVTKMGISDRCQAFCFALVCFNDVFSLMFTANEKVNMAVDHPKLQGLLEKGLMAWQNLKEDNKEGYKNIPPKLHALVQHLLGQFKEYGGIGDYDEQFVERSHQCGKKDMLRTRAIHCRNQKYNCFARWEEVRSHPEVLKKREAVKNSRKRKFQEERGVSMTKLAAYAKGAGRRHFIESFVPKIIPSARQLRLHEEERIKAAAVAANAGGINNNNAAADDNDDGGNGENGDDNDNNGNDDEDENNN